MNSIKKEIDYLQQIFNLYGFSIDIQGLLGVFHRGDREIYFLFLCSLQDGEFQISAEVDDFRYYSLSEMPSCPDSQTKIIGVLHELAKISNTWPFLDADSLKYYDVNQLA